MTSSFMEIFNFSVFLLLNITLWKFRRNDERKTFLIHSHNAITSVFHNLIAFDFLLLFILNLLLIYM